MEQEAALGMLEKLGKLRKLLADYDREMQRLKKENEWLKKVLEDCEGNRVGADGKSVVEQAAELSKLRAEVQELRKEKAGLADMLGSAHTGASADRGDASAPVHQV